VAGDGVIGALERAVAADPGDRDLRAHLAELLVVAGRGAEAIAHLGVLLQDDPEDASARALMARALGTPMPTFDWAAAEDDLGPVAPRCSSRARGRAATGPRRPG
jgi:predicted Zn-dependent protease